MRSQNRHLTLAIAMTVVATSALGVNVRSTEAPTASCEVAEVKGEIYFPNTSRSIVVSPSNAFRTPRPSFIVNAESEIDVWYGNGGAADCTEAWYRASNYSPGQNFSVNSFYNNSCRLIRSADPTKPFAQIVFRVAYKEESGVLAEQKPEQYFYFATGSSKQEFPPDQHTRQWSDVRLTGNACLNYFARWCGDGIVSHGEQCDPGPNASNSTNCTQTCERR